MKADARRIADAAAKWPANVRAILLYGPDTAASADHASRVQRQFADPSNPAAVTLLTGSEVAGDPQALVGATAEFSMFGDRTLVRVDDATDDDAGLAAVLAAPPGNPLVIVAGALKKGSALAALAEKHPEVLSLQSYEPSARDAFALVGGIAAENGLRPTRQAAQAIFEAAGGDRATIRQEVEKLALYMDADPAKQTPVDMPEIRVVGAGVDEGDPDALVSAIASGQQAQAAALLARLDARGAAGITALRAMQRRLWLLIDLRQAVDGGASPESAVAGARPPVFWKARDEVAAQLKRWRTPALRAAAHSLLAAERGIKTSGSAGEVLAADALLTLARSGKQL